MNINRFLVAVASFIGILVVIAGVGLVIWWLIRPQFEILRSRENREVIAFHDHFDLDPDIPHIVLEGQRLRDIVPPLIHNGVPFLPFDFVRFHIDPFIFWDAGAQYLFVTTRQEMRYFRHGDIRVAGGEVYIPADLIMGLYPFTVAYHPEYNMVVVTDDREAQTTANLSSQTPVRYRPDISAPITVRLNAGERVVLFREPGSANDYWTRVRTGNGLLGYVQTSSLGAAETRLTAVNRTPMLNDFINNLQPHTPNWPAGKKINMVWEQVYTQPDNERNKENPLPESLTAVSPNWFRFNADTMALDSVACADYVKWAQGQGVLVFPNVTDTSARDGIQLILSDINARRRIIGQLVDYVDELGLDGLSINIESISLFRYGPYYVQFMRELNIALGGQVVLLAAMKADSSVNPHYHHDLIALTVDFVALMTYDEHSANSAVPGPVASLPWVERQITEMLRHVPANQLLLGLPFYNRIWRTCVTDNSRRNPAHWDMDRTVREFYNQGVSWEPDAEIRWEWNPIIGSYYAEFAAVVNGEPLRHQLWLECARSIEEKMQIFAVYNLAGVAGWNNGFSNQEVWDLLGRYFIWNPQE